MNALSMRIAFTIAKSNYKKSQVDPQASGLGISGISQNVLKFRIIEQKNSMVCKWRVRQQTIRWFQKLFSNYEKITQIKYGGCVRCFAVHLGRFPILFYNSSNFRTFFLELKSGLREKYPFQFFFRGSINMKRRELDA